MFTLTPSSTNLSDGPGNVNRDRPRGRRIRQNDQNDRQRRREFIHVDSSETQPLGSLVRGGAVTRMARTRESKSLLLTFLSTNPEYSADFERSGVENATFAFENRKNPGKIARKVNNRL